jgi:hypothetical protein
MSNIEDSNLNETEVNTSNTAGGSNLRRGKGSVKDAGDNVMETTTAWCWLLGYIMEYYCGYAYASIAPILRKSDLSSLNNTSFSTLPSYFFSIFGRTASCNLPFQHILDPSLRSSLISLLQTSSLPPCFSSSPLSSSFSIAASTSSSSIFGILLPFLVKGFKAEQVFWFTADMTLRKSILSRDYFVRASAIDASTTLLSTFIHSFFQLPLVNKYTISANSSNASLSEDVLTICHSLLTRLHRALRSDPPSQVLFVTY